MPSVSAENQFITRRRNGSNWHRHSLIFVVPCVWFGQWWRENVRSGQLNYFLALIQAETKPFTTTNMMKPYGERCPNNLTHFLQRTSYLALIVSHVLSLITGGTFFTGIGKSCSPQLWCWPLICWSRDRLVCVFTVHVVARNVKIHWHRCPKRQKIKIYAILAGYFYQSLNLKFDEFSQHRFPFKFSWRWLLVWPHWRQ